MDKRAHHSRIIDYDRGVIIRTMASSGMDVFMYVDEPGKFLDAFGREVNTDVAKLAGFDTERLIHERNKRERMAEAFAQIEHEMETVGGSAVKTILERGGYKVEDIGLGRHRVLDNEGNFLTPVPVPLEVAQLLFDKLVPEEKPTKGKK